MISYIIIDGWKSNIRFSSAHIIPDYEKCGRLHGHTYAVHAKISGKLDKNGIIMDFSQHLKIRGSGPGLRKSTILKVIFLTFLAMTVLTTIKVRFGYVPGYRGNGLRKYPRPNGQDDKFNLWAWDFYSIFILCQVKNFIFDWNSIVLNMLLTQYQVVMHMQMEQISSS